MWLASAWLGLTHGAAQTEALVHSLGLFRGHGRPAAHREQRARPSDCGLAAIRTLGGLFRVGATRGRA